MKYEGSCHCGHLKFSFDVPLTKAIECNCSHCRRKGYLLTFLPKSEVQITLPDGAYSSYRFNKHVIEHIFCKTCGFAPFGFGKGHDGVTETVAINLRCLDTALNMSELEIMSYDGASA